MPTTAFLWVFFLSFGLVVLLTPLAMSIGERWHIVDTPGGRRRHKGRVVRLGGLGLYPAFLVAALAPFVLGIPRDDPLEVTRLTGVLLGMGFVWIVGLLDDRFKFPSWVQLAGLVLAALIAVFFKVFIEVFNNPFNDAQIEVDWYLMLPITLVWIVGITGTMNVLDGLDGLATGVTGISALLLFIHMLRLEQFSVALLPLALFGCCLGFLVYNFNPARIFLGGGAYVLGYALSTLSIVAGAKVALALLVFWLPLLDAIWQIYSRWKRGQPIGLGDRGHLHFRLQDRGWPTWRIVLIYYAVTALLGMIALFSPSRPLKFVALVLLSIIILFVLSMLARGFDKDTMTGD
jgi:UDP-GlcNAc:undecaprenyl-phosphate GlcNAc-1-phosphate transferase